MGRQSRAKGCNLVSLAFIVLLTALARVQPDWMQDLHLVPLSALRAIVDTTEITVEPADIDAPASAS